MHDLKLCSAKSFSCKTKSQNAIHFFHTELAIAHVAKDRSSTREKSSYKSYLVKYFSLIIIRL